MSVLIYSPKNSIRRIDSVWLAVSVDKGGEGVCAISAGGVLMPLIAADKDRLVWLKDTARQLAELQRKQIQLIRMTTRVDLGPLPPDT